MFWGRKKKEVINGDFNLRREYFSFEEAAQFIFNYNPHGEPWPYIRPVEKIKEDLIYMTEGNVKNIHLLGIIPSYLSSLYDGEESIEGFIEKQIRENEVLIIS